MTSGPFSHHDHSAPGSSGGWRALLTFVIVVGLLLAVGLIAALVSRRYIATKLPPGTAASIHRYKTTVISLPPKWHQPANLTRPDVLAFHNRFAREMEGFRVKHEQALSVADSGIGSVQIFWKNGHIGDDELTTFSALLPEIEHLIDETSAGVSLPGYSLEIDHMLTSSNFFEMQNFAKLMALTADVYARRGDCDGAIQAATLPLRLAKRPEDSYVITHLIGIAMTNTSVKALGKVCQTCRETAHLGAALHRLNELRDDVLPGDINRWYQEPLMMVRYAAAYGYPARLEPQTEAEIISQSQRLGTKYWRWLIDRYPPTDPRAVAARELLDRFSRNPMPPNTITPWLQIESEPSDLKRFYVWAATGHDADLLNYAMQGEINVLEARTRAYTSMAMYDLLRLELATGFSRRVSVGEVPLEKLLGELPKDPFSTGTEFLEVNEVAPPYSIGPDRLDDAMRMMYDPTNGTISGGDVWLERQ